MHKAKLLADSVEVGSYIYLSQEMNIGHNLGPEIANMDSANSIVPSISSKHGTERPRPPLHYVESDDIRLRDVITNKSWGKYVRSDGGSDGEEDARSV